jgi:translation elongation factor EF-G
MADLISRARIAIIGQKSAELATALALEPVDFEEADGAIFIVSANEGIVSADLETWRTARELYVPSIVVVSDLISSEIDFEDMSAIASKMLDPIVTPYLVLHGDDGAPVALISLKTLEVTDYSNGTVTKRPADPEHEELVADFKSEYMDAIEEAGEESFQAGLLFPALPWIEKTGMGISEIKEYLNLIPTIG